MLAEMNLKTETTTANRRLAKKRVLCLNEALCFFSSSVLADSLVLRNPLLRQAPKRCASCCRTCGCIGRGKIKTIFTATTPN